MAYTVSVPDIAKDRADSDIWMTSWDGSRSLRLTTSKSERAHAALESRRPVSGIPLRPGRRRARWTRSGCWIARAARRSGSPICRAASSDYAWSPDGKRLALIASDPDPDSATVSPDTTKRTHRPIVIDRFQFKEDETGYLDARRDHLYLFDLASRKGEILTPGEYDELRPPGRPTGARSPS